MNIFYKSLRFKTWLKRLFFSLFLVFSILQIVPSLKTIPEVQAIRCDEVVEDGKTASELWIPCANKGHSAPDEELVDETIREKDLTTQVLKIVNYVLTFVALIAVLAVIYSGFLMVTSMGNDEQYEKGKKGVGYMAIGLILILLSFGIVNWIIDSVSEGDGTDTGDGTNITDPNNPNGNNGDNIFNDTYYIDEYYYEITENPPVNLDDLKRELERIRDDANKELREEINNFINNLNKYIESPSDQDWEKFYNTYQDFINNYGDVLDGTVMDELNLDLDALKKTLKNLKDTLSDYGLDYNDFVSNLNSLEMSLEKLQKEFGEYDLDISELMDLYQKYKDDPTEENWKKFAEAYEDFWEEVSNMPAVRTVITASTVSGNAPLNVALNGFKSTDPGNETIPDGNHHWSYIDAGGKEVNLPKKAAVTVEFDEAGSYIINLRTESASVNKEGKKTVLDGYGYKKITVEPPTTQFNLEINNDEVNTYYKVDLETAKKGLEFDITDAEPPQGRKFTTFFWDFGDGESDEKFDADTFKHAYGKSEEYTVKLTLTDNFKEKHVKRFKIAIQDVVAKAEVSPEKGEITTQFKFNSSKSRPDSDKIIEYLWKVEDDSGKTILESEERYFEHIFNEPGIYRVDLTVTNADWESDTETKEITVESRKPEAHFDWEIEKNSMPNVVTFNAFESFDLDNEELTYEWDFDGDGVFEKTELKEHLVTHTFDKVGQYKTKLKVIDAFGNFDIEEKNIEITSVLSVDFSASTYAAPQNSEITFKAIADKANAYYWDFSDGNIFQTEENEMKYSFQESGVFNVTLKVFDDDGASNSVTQKIYIGDADMPIAVIDYSVDSKKIKLTENLCWEKAGLSVYRSSKITFDASKSVNVSGKKTDLEYIWDFGDGIYSTQKTPTHYYTELSKDKCIKVTLKVKDKELSKVSKSEEIYINIQNRLPQMSFLEIIPVSELLTPVTFKLWARGVADYDGKIIKYRWWYYKEWDEENERGVKTTSSPSAEITVMGDGLPGIKNNYHFVVEMTDDNNGVVNSSELFKSDVSYEIENGKNVSPIVDFTVDKTLLYVGDSVNFYATAADPQGSEIPDNAYKWDFDGNGEFDDVSSGKQVSRRFNIPGEYEVRLKVDLNGLSTSKTKKIIVKRINDFPEAAFIFSVDGKTVSFDASNSRFDETLEDKELWYSWDFDISKDQNGNGIKDDDDQDNGVTPKHTYAADGTYTVRLLVKDKLGSTDIVERMVSIGSSSFSTVWTGTLATKESLKLSSEGLLSSLDLTMLDLDLERGNMVDITARIVQAGGGLYNDIVTYRIIEGSGSFIPSQVNAKNGVAISTFKAESPGVIIVEVTAPMISGWPLREQISFKVK